MPGVFVTGTGTDVGKTFVTAALVRHLRSSGKTVDAYKPVVSGFDPANAADSDRRTEVQVQGFVHRCFEPAGNVEAGALAVIE